jgi:hypothetical protein
MSETLAGIPFVAVAHHDVRMFRTPGVYALARRHGSHRTLLYVGQAEEVSAAYGGRIWSVALQAGMNEVLVNLTATERLDRLQLVARLVRACRPELNGEAGPTPGASGVETSAPFGKRFA